MFLGHSALLGEIRLTGKGSSGSSASGGGFLGHPPSFADAVNVYQSVAPSQTKTLVLTVPIHGAHCIFLFKKKLFLYLQVLLAAPPWPVFTQVCEIGVITHFEGKESEALTDPVA